MPNEKALNRSAGGEAWTKLAALVTDSVTSPASKRTYAAAIDQDFHFDHPGTDNVAEPRLRCKGSFFLVRLSFHGDGHNQRDSFLAFSDMTAQFLPTSIGARGPG